MTSNSVKFNVSQAKKSHENKTRAVGAHPAENHHVDYEPISRVEKVHHNEEDSEINHKEEGEPVS